MTVWQSLSYEWVGLLVIIVETIVAFAVAYAKFMRMDIR
jgi:ABC-type transport system involved in multi-copper enzyme maturation permease subunit